MGVRFPTQQQRPDLGQIQQARDIQQNAGQQQEAQAPATEQRAPAPEEPAANETQDPRALAQQAPVERAADDAGAQTPGSIIDMLA